MVIGGGPIGVELTAELVSFAHDTHITLASPHLLPRFPPGAGKYAAKWLSERKVLLLPARVSPAQVLSDGSYEYVYTTETGEQRVRANLTFDCTGARSNGSVRALLSGGVIEATQVTKDGSVCVRDTLQTTAHEHIFVIGDAGRVDNELLLRPHGRGCEKTAYAAEACGVVAGHNVMRLIEQGGRMYKYPDDMFLRGVFPRVVAISLYSPHAILCVGPVVISGWGVGVVKWMIERLCIRGMNESWAALSFRFLENASFFSASILTLLSERMQRGMR